MHETLTTPDTLRAALKKAADAVRDMEATEREITARETELALSVLGAVNADGKPFYSNDTARKSAIERAQAEDATLHLARVTMTDLRHAKAYAEADAEACRYALRLQVAQLAARAD